METVAELRDAGHTVIAHYSTEDGAGEAAWKKIKASPPDALVISLVRLPSHGRQIAAVTTEFKKLKAVPVIFVDGEKDKIDAAREQFPKARCVSAGTLLDVLRRLSGTQRPAPPKAVRSVRKVRAKS